MYYNSTTIEIFLSTAHTHSFTKTAEQYYMSQQAVSKRIIEFERECGVQLFLRTTKSLELTPAGKELFTFFSREQSELNYNGPRELDQGFQNNRESDMIDKTGKGDPNHVAHNV